MSKPTKKGNAIDEAIRERDRRYEKDLMIIEREKGAFEKMREILEKIQEIKDGESNEIDSDKRIALLEADLKRKEWDLEFERSLVSDLRDVISGLKTLLICSYIGFAIILVILYFNF